MQLPLTEPETLCEKLWQDLPPETGQMARACQAFVRAKKVKTPAPLLRVVFLYGGVDKSLRAVAGTCTALSESMTDPAVAERLRACGPWGKAMLRRRRPLSAVEPLPQGRRFVGIDASSMQAPGAPGPDPRLPSALALVSLPFLEVFVSDVHTGETRTHCPLAPGEVAVADRGYAHWQGMSAAVQPGADRIVRLPPCSVVRRDAVGAPVELCAAWKRQHTETLRTLAVALWGTGGQHAVGGGVQAYRLHAEPANRARHTCRQGHKKGPPTAASLWVAGGGLVLTPLAPAVRSAQTIMALDRCRWHVESARKRWKSVRDVDALRAKAPRPWAEVWLQGPWRSAWRLERRMRRQWGASWGRLDHERVGTWWRLWGMRKDERAPLMTGAMFWKEEAWAACWKVLRERPRRRK
jgi:hypothetical protein